MRRRLPRPSRHWCGASARTIGWPLPRTPLPFETQHAGRVRRRRRPVRLRQTSGGPALPWGLQSSFALDGRRHRPEVLHHRRRRIRPNTHVPNTNSAAREPSAGARRKGRRRWPMTPAYRSGSAQKETDITAAFAHLGITPQDRWLVDELVSQTAHCVVRTAIFGGWAAVVGDVPDAARRFLDEARTRRLGDLPFP
jgi:hypothetical protein